MTEHGKKIQVPYAAIVFAICLGATFFFQPLIWKFVLTADIKYQALYSTLFDLNAIFLAFLFSYFSFIQTADNPFLHRVRKSETFSRFVSQIKSTMTTSAMLLFVSVLTIAVAPVPGAIFEYQNLLFSLWTAMTFLVVFRFISLNRIFWILISQ